MKHTHTHKCLLTKVTTVLWGRFYSIHWLTWIHSLFVSQTHTALHTYPPTLYHTNTHVSVSQSVSQGINSPPKGVGNWAMVQSVSCRPASNSCKTTQRNLELSFLHSFTLSSSEKQHKETRLVHRPEHTKSTKNRKRHLSESLLTCRKLPERGKTKHRSPHKWIPALSLSFIPLDHIHTTTMY